MAKLYFRYGTVGSAKTLNLLAVAHAYQQQNKKAFLIKPRIDTRFGADAIGSRAGLVRKADLLVDEETIIPAAALADCHCILVDEVQFLSESLIEQFRAIATNLNVPVICYGLRTDFRGRLFAGSQRLMELADAIEEVKTTCSFCNRKAIFNLKLMDGLPTLEGPVIELGKEEKYIPTCPHCYEQSLHRALRKKTSSIRNSAVSPIADNNSIIP
jgi:thymidine kinase